MKLAVRSVCSFMRIHNFTTLWINDFSRTDLTTYIFLLNSHVIHLGISFLFKQNRRQSCKGVHVGSFSQWVLVTYVALKYA